MDEGSDQSIVMPEIVTSPDVTLLKDATQEDRRHQIHDFLERPVFLDTILWDVTQSAGQVLTTYRFPDRLLSYVGNIAKTRGFYGFRADVELIVKVNRQPFQAGLLMISYCPNARYNTAKAAQHEASLRTRSGAPRVTLNLKQDTEASLCVPYASPFVYYNLLTQQGTIGDFKISVYSPLSDVASTGTVPISVFARFKNVDLQFPTGSAPTFFGAHAARLSAIDKFYSEPTDANFKRLTDFVTQSNSDTIMNIKPRALPHMTEPNTSNTSHVMSLNPNSRLSSNSMIGSSQSDEMSIANICSIPTYYDSFPWKGGSNSGDVIWSTLIKPQPDNFTLVSGVVNADYIYTLSEMFALWHSSFIFTFRIVSTPYHSGRLRVWFSPNTTVSDDIDRNAVYTEIVDLKDATDFQFTVPWCHPFPFLNVKAPGDTSLGMLAVEVLNPLVSPATVDADIQLVVERNAGPDISFQLPGAIRKAPYNPTLTTERRRRRPLSRGYFEGGSIPIQQSVHQQRPIQQQPSNNRNFNGRLQALASSSFISPVNATYIKENIANYAKDRIDYINQAFHLDPQNQQILSFTLDQLKTYVHRHLELKKRDLTDMKSKDIGPMYETQSNVDNAPQQDSARGGAAHPYFVRPKQCVEADSNCLSLNTTHISDLLKRSTKFFDLQLSSPGPTGYALSFSAPSGDGVTETTVTHPAIGTDVPSGTVTTIGPLPVVVVDAVPGPVSSMHVIPTGSSITITVLTTSHSAKIVCAGFPDGYVPFVATDPGGQYSDIGAYYSDEWPYTVTAIPLTPSSVTAQNAINIQPHFLGTGYTSGTPGTIAATAVDNITYLSSLFTFMRGGVTLRVLTDPAQYGIALDPTNSINVISPSFGPVDSATTPLSALDKYALQNTINQIINSQVEGFGEIRVPFFSNTHSISVDNLLSQGTGTALNDFTIPRTKLILDLQSPTNYVTLYRSADDDFSLSYLSGPPLLCEVTDP